MTDNRVENEAREGALGGIGSSEYRAILGLCGKRGQIWTVGSIGISRKVSISGRTHLTFLQWYKNSDAGQFLLVNGRRMSVLDRSKLVCILCAVKLLLLNRLLVDGRNRRRQVYTQLLAYNSTW
jgi:hypothetical protein